jgi:NADH-quinone oxidoreductase subunit G
LQKIGVTPIYAVDELTRLSKPLQQTPLASLQAAAILNRQTAGKAGLGDSEQVQLRQDNGTAVLPLRIDESVPDGCICVPLGIEAVRHLGAAFGKIDVEKVS